MSMLVTTNGLPAQKGPPTPVTQILLPTVTPESEAYESAKVILDWIFAFVLLVCTAPLILLAMVLVKLTSPGPAIYTQTRVGKNGRPFTIYKLRTMSNNCESLTGAQWCKPGDSRVTRVGRWLRKTHIDELPQLWNVLKGEMSLIGPRPERPEFVPTLEVAIALYRERLRIRPGLSGFAQLQLPPDTDLESVRIKLAYDLYYVRHMNLLFDIAVYVGTLAKVLGMSQCSIRWLCRFTPRDVVDDAYRKLADVTNDHEPKT